MLFLTISKTEEVRTSPLTTSKPRMTRAWVIEDILRDFEASDAVNRLPAETGYSKGVPMGGELSSAPRDKVPTFLVGAMKDPYSGNLDRVQIVKGWLDKSGKTHEKVYNVVWGDADNRKPGRDGKLPAVGSTVNVEKATWSNTTNLFD